MKLPLFIVDSFSSGPFTGNPAAVCLLGAPAADDWMQQVAAEMNLAETAFVLPEEGDFRLRWFTPVLEVDLCGHATLASAHVLWEAGGLPPDRPVRFRTRSGLLTVQQTEDGVSMDFPAAPSEPFAEGAELAELFRVRPVNVRRHGMQGLLELENAAAVRSLHPDMSRLARYPLRGVIVTARSDDQAYDFVSRYFAPRAGIPEDPVTGSAHCCLAPYWSERLGKRDLVGYQASPRGGVVRVRANGDRVCLCGRARTVLRGEWCGSFRPAAETATAK